jgi:hypothetical protein
LIKFTPKVRPTQPQLDSKKFTLWRICASEDSNPV